MNIANEKNHWLEKIVVPAEELPEKFTGLKE